MGKPTGFLEFSRELPVKRPVENRINDYNEFVERFSNEKLNNQAARCMDCGVPFCHNGCPLGNLIPDFNDAVYRQNWLQAYQILSATNNFPEFTGRICPAPCEGACVLGINQPPITIEEIEKHIIEIAFEKGYVKPFKPFIRTEKKVAVIGSGPAGLAAAAQLNYAGHQVTVFERDDAPGGLLRYGIPDFKLEKWVVDRRIDLLKQEGIEFRCNIEVGNNYSIYDVLREFDAIVLAGGSTIPRNLDIPGRNLKGVHFAMDYLKQQNKRKNNQDFEGQGIYAHDKDVVIIGGGDTGSDCVGTANRQKARSVSQLELLPQPPLERTAHMPWPTYPMTLKITSSHEEGANRHWAVATKKLLGDDEGNLRALELVDLEWKLAEDGRYAQFVEVPGSEREVPCQMAFLAMGFLFPKKEGLLMEMSIQLDDKGNVKTGDDAYQTNIEKVFAAGDMRRGQSLVVWAIQEGRECAKKVDEYLTLSPSKYPE